MVKRLLFSGLWTLPPTWHEFVYQLTGYVIVATIDEDTEKVVSYSLKMGRDYVRRDAS